LRYFVIATPAVPDWTGILFTILEVALYTQAKESYAPCADGSKTVLVVGVGR